MCRLVEEAGDVDLLRAQTLARGGDDGRVEAQPLGGLDARRSAGDTETQLVVGRERHFIHAGRGVEHAGCVGRVNLERGVMGGDERPRAGGEKVAGNGDGQRRALFGIGGGAELVEQDQRVGAGEAREAVEIDDVRGEGGELGLDGLRVADVGQECGEDGKAGRRGGHGQAGLGHHGQQGGGLEGDGFAAGVGTADDELAICGGELQGERNDMAAGRAQVLFEQRMARGFEAQQIGRDGGGDAVIVAGKAGAGLQAVHQRENARAFDERRGHSRRPGA